MAQDPSWGLGGGVPPGSGHPGCRLVAAPVRAAVATAPQHPRELAPRLSLVLRSDPGWPQEPSPGALLALPAFPLSGPSEHRPHMSSPLRVTPPLLQPSQSPSRCQPDLAHLGALGSLCDERGSSLPHQSCVPCPLPPPGTSRGSPTGARGPPGGPHLPGSLGCMLSHTQWCWQTVMGPVVTSGRHVAEVWALGAGSRLGSTHKCPQAPCTPRAEAAASHSGPGHPAPDSVVTSG